MFDLQFVSLLTWILFSCGITAAILYLATGPLRYRQLIRMVRSQESAGVSTVPADTDGNPLKISVVAYGRGHIEETGAFLEAIKRQDYPEVEVIIVTDGSARDATTLTETFGKDYPGASFSFVPPEALNLSRRKLANTIGIKKASGQIILTTLTNIRIPSEQWLSMMASQFSSADTEIVLGAAFMDFSHMHGMGRWYRRFDSLLTAAQWMIAAIDGSPYRGDGANLAFRRDLFFRNSGYGNNYYLHSGDDDIFVSQVSTPGNSRFMLAPRATVHVDWGTASDRIWTSQKERYSFAERYLSRSPRLKQAVRNISLWAATALLVAAALTAMPADLTLPCMAAAALLVLWSVQTALYRKLAETFGSVRLWWSVPVFYLLRPIADSIVSLRSLSRRNQNFTWRR